MDVASPHIEVRYEFGRAWVTLVTNDGDRFQMEALASGQPIRLDQAKLLAHRVARERGIGLVVVPDE
jgi:hypothetical protein